MNTTTKESLIDHLCGSICEAELAIDQYEVCIECMEDEIAENYRMILYNRGVIDNAESTLAQIECEDYDAEDDDTVKFQDGLDAYEALTGILDDPAIHYVQLRRSDKPGAAYIVDPVSYDKDPGEQQITVSISGDQ